MRADCSLQCIGIRRRVCRANDADHRPKIFWSTRPALSASPHVSQCHTMIQRSLLRQSRVASSSIRARCRAPITRAHFPPVRIYQPLGGIARRWQSTTSDSNGNANSEASTSEASSDAAKEGDPIKKELEAKNKEIIDLKVRLQGFTYAIHTLISSYHRINTSAQ